MRTRALKRAKQQWMLFICQIGISFLPIFSFAKDYGLKGHSFAIHEENLIEVIKRKTSQIPYQKLHETAIQNIIKQDAAFIPKQAKIYRSFYLDPTFTVSSDIKDLKGKIIVRKGEQVNPLTKRTISSALLFIDGTNQEQVNWASQQKGTFKWILVKGDPISLEEERKQPVYFDQGEQYVRHFRISCFPAKVSQVGQRLQIEEIPLKQGRGE